MEKVKVSIEQTEDSYYISMLGEEKNLYIDAYDNGEIIIINVFKDNLPLMNWEGSLNDLINKLK